MKLRRILYLGVSALLFLFVFIIDVVRKNVELNISGLLVARDILVIGAFVLIYMYFEARRLHYDLTPIKRLGLVMIYSVIVGLLCLLVVVGFDDNFDRKDLTLLPLNYGQLFIATFLSIVLGVFAILLFRLVRGLVLFKRKRETERNFLIFVGFTLATALSTIPLQPLDSSTFTNILLGFAILFAVINSFRLPWIVYLTKREKVFGLIYGFVLFLVLIGINVALGVDRSLINKSLLYHSYPLDRFIFLTTIFCNIYFGMAFVSTLFHLPTAEAFDRKTTEVTSLSNLGKLVTQVFDFNELVDTVTSMTLQVCEAKSCWLEIIHYDNDSGHPAPGNEGRGIPDGVSRNYVIQVAGKKNISQQEIDALLSAGKTSLRDEVIARRKAIVVDDLKKDARFTEAEKAAIPHGSLVVVPLVSHAGMVGILYATKDGAYSFFKDDVDVISAFADQATVAIENSRLIEKSLERERLLREMTLAQEIQRKLLPQKLPVYQCLEIDAVSLPAFEVGGDYYDVVELGERKLGVVVGDVSGKGVSAAFYMSEVKGIFQSLSRLYPSPREFMIRANEALSGSIDKHSFVTLIYAVLDLVTGTVTLARAGHCPLLHFSGEHATYLRPDGMGLGLSNGTAFEQSMEESTIHLKPGDLCVFYTDGVTEARRGDDEFGYERLLQTVAAGKEHSAASVKDAVVHTAKTFSDKAENDDDLTVVVVKWLGESWKSG